MIDHAIQIALPVFRTAFPSCIVVFAFYNASNHAYFASDVLRTEKLNKGPGGAQSLMREGSDHYNGLPQTMQFAQRYQTLEHAGKPEGLMQILEERGLWDREHYVSCPTSDGQPGCGPEGRCCARKILAAERDFREQKGRLQEGIEARGYKVIPHPSPTASLRYTGANLSGILESTVTTVLNDYVKLFLKL